MSLIAAKVSRTVLHKNGCVYRSLRNIMSPAFSCTKEWNDRTQTDALKKINAADHFRKLKQAFDNGAFVAAIDMDIVSNKLQDIHPLSLDLLESIFYKFRHTSESLKSLKSTTYAFFRTLIDCGEHNKIVELLEDKSSYGLFLDSHMAIMLMDHFIEEKSYNDAGRIVFDVMLQEELDDPILRALSLYTCQQILSSPDFKIEAPPAGPKNAEIIYRKIQFIHNPWYDDHFDTYSVNQKVGKSLLQLCTSDDVVSRGFQFLGNILFLKFDKAMNLAKTWMETQDSPVISEAHLELAESLLRNIETATVEVPTEIGLVRLGHLLPHVTEEQKALIIAEFETLKEQLLKEGKVAKDVNVDEYVKEFLNNTLAEHEEASIENQKKIFDRWNKTRDSMLAGHLKKLSIKQKKDDIAKRLIDLTSKEEKLRYFEEKINIDLALEGVPEYPEIEEVVIEEQFVAPPNERRVNKKRK